MKRLILLFIILITSISCSKSIEIYNCEEWGLTISKTEAVYGRHSYFFCKQEGNWSLYNTDQNKCDQAYGRRLNFDVITYKLTVYSPEDIEFVQCKKIK